VSGSARARRRRGRTGTFVLVAVLAVGVAAALGSHRTVTRPEAHTVAVAISLRRDDVPTLSAHSNPITSQQKRFSAQLTACVGGVPQSQVYAQAQSPTFTGSGSSSLTLSSATEILPSAALVAKDLDAIRGAKGLPCLQRQLGTQLQASLAKGDRIAIHGAALPAVVSGSDGTFALRFNVVVTIKVASGTLHVQLYYDTIGFAYGQAEVGFDLLTTAVKPPSALERKLGASLRARARAALG
jgi:hypothetical protein